MEQLLKWKNLVISNINGDAAYQSSCLRAHCTLIAWIPETALESNLQREIQDQLI